MKLSNKFTLVRVIFAPIFFLLYFIPIWTGKFTFSSLLIALPCLIFAEFTDYLDGHYARKHNEVSDFGKLFDPFADVILHLTTFVCFMKSVNPEISYLPVVILLFIMLREFSQNFLTRGRGARNPRARGHMCPCAQAYRLFRCARRVFLPGFCA